MRVYELAKKLQTSSNDVLSQAEKLDIEVYSSLSQMDSGEVKKLEAAFGQRTPEEIARAVAERKANRSKKRDLERSVRLEKTKASGAILEEVRRKSMEMDAQKHGKKSEKVQETSAAASVAPAVKPETPPAAKQAEVSSPTPTPVAGVPPPNPAPAAVGLKATPPPPAPRRAEAPVPVPSKPVVSKPAAPLSSTGRGNYFDKDDEEEYENLHLSSSDRGRISKSTGRDFQKPSRNGGAAPRGNGRDNGNSASRYGQQRGSYPGNNSRQGGRYNQQGRNGGNNRRTPNTPQKPAAPAAASVPLDHVLQLRGAIVVRELAEKLGLRPNRLITDLMQLNILASINQHVEIDVATKIAEKYGFKVEIERQKRSTERRPVLKSEDADDDIPEDKPEDMLPRPPVVTFLGHVDHGKTSLMDKIRNARVASGEAGGITQHIGAYQVDVSGRKITFLDSPGHAAFSAMRMRGATLTDIAVIIIAADDGIMPQTREAIAAARKAGVQIMVAINKCDLPTAKPDRVRQQLQGEGLTPEEWGGDCICCEVSAHTGEGLDHLLEMILLLSDMLELTANPNRRADGYVVEAQLATGSGPTATILVTGGKLSVGDVVLCGEYFGKVRGLIDDRGRRVKSVGPSSAVKCIGLSGVPEPGAKFRVMLNEKRARELAEKTAEENKIATLSTSKATSLDALMRQMSDNEKRSLSVIVKADTQGSLEAICESLREIQSEKVALDIISEGVGNVLSTDVSNAAASKSIIVGFNVGTEPGVQQQARHDTVRINTFRIIYELLDHVKQCMLDLLPPEYEEVVKGHAEIRAIFDIGKTGRIAGCQLTDGMLIAKGHFRIFRKKEQLWEGKILSLKHFQNEVAEVTGAQECGIHFNGFEDFQPGDTVECFALEEKPRTL